MVSGMQIAALAALAIVLVALAIWLLLRKRNNPDKRELERRTWLNLHGRFGEAFITEVADGFIYYNYSIHGVQYETSQDVHLLAEHLPLNADRMIGPAGMKYAGNNPANSILLCEEWSGLRQNFHPTRDSEPLPDRDAIGHQA